MNELGAMRVFPPRKRGVHFSPFLVLLLSSSHWLYPALLWMICIATLQMGASLICLIMSVSIGRVTACRRSK
jgi:hypothetical protein